MSTRGRSTSPRPLGDADMDIDRSPVEKQDAKVVIVTNLTRNVAESHLQTIFGFYGPIVKVDLPVFGKSGQNRGKAALEYADPPSAHKAASHMDGGQLDGAILKVELSNLPVRSRSPSPRVRLPPPPRLRNGRDLDRPRTRRLPSAARLVPRPWWLRPTWTPWTRPVPPRPHAQPFAFAFPATARWE
ncbi:putative RNA recognition motif containing protein [Lyophyllum shimeji]|uniref:RNA recognition motif containing protein n=1 Tax=Lyophyllum shimeji TaxID=47721 RepID=A0A9P3PDN5_LYOSH|nr:putative RNA recognition motif containing protein [Lyophyllum shimeji]